MSGGTRTLRIHRQDTVCRGARQPMQTQESVMNLNSLSLAGAAAGSPGLAPATVRRLGLALMVIGTLLAVGGGYLALQLAPTLLHPGELIGGERFTGSAALGRQVLALLSVVALTGVACAGVGVHQWRTGRRDKRLLALAGIMLAATVLTAVSTGAMLG